MARPRPKLQWETIANMPPAVLLRHLPDLDFDDRPSGPAVSSGGKQRQSLTARAGGLFRKGSQIYCSFVLRTATQHGISELSNITTRRQSYTAHELRQMLEGQMKAPSGLTEKMITNSLAVLDARKAALQKNNQRAAAHYLKKLAQYA